MTGTDASPKSVTWDAPGHSLTIEYCVAVLEQIREIAVDGYHRVPHGGVETGGILFGTHQENLVRIVAWRPIACSYARGPSFLLSEQDEAILTEALQAYQYDAELAPLEPVGWYRAHTRSEVLLAEADLAFFDRFFPQPWQVGLIVRPGSFSPTRAGFFFRESDGTIQSQSSYREFVLAPVAMDQAPMPAEIAPAPAPSDTELATAPESESGEPMPDELGAPPHRSVAWKWYAASLLVLAIAALGYWVLRPARPDLTLSATDVGGQLRIAWDGSAASVGQARSGSMEIDDHGVHTQVALTPADLRSGNLIYARQSSDVGIRLIVDVPGHPPLVESTRFLKPGEIATAASPHPPLGTDSQPDESPRPEVKSTAAPAAAPANKPRPMVAFRAPDRPVSGASPEMPGIAPPSIDNLPAASPPGIASVVGPPAPSPATPVAPRAATASPPASGRIIWTGKLARSSRLVVEGNHASSGAVSGTLPSVAARVSAYPGDLTANGITLFTADPRYTKPLTEKAGAENGWNSTTYTWDPRRATGIRILEQPGPQNGYKLVLQSDIPKLSVVVLDWRAAQ